MQILKHGVVRQQHLTGKCPVCRGEIKVDEVRDKGLIQRDCEGISLVKCPTPQCRGKIVVQYGWV
jgi:hypothetical protein